MQILASLLPGANHPSEDVAKPLQPAHEGPSLPLLNPVISGVQGSQWPLVLARDQAGPLLHPLFVPCPGPSPWVVGFNRDKRIKQPRAIKPPSSCQNWFLSPFSSLNEGIFGIWFIKVAFQPPEAPELRRRILCYYWSSK